MTTEDIEIPTGAGLKTYVDGPVATLTLARPQVRNAFDEHLIGALLAALDAVAGIEAIRVVVLAGEGRAFSAGADLDWMQRMAAADQATNEADANALAALMAKLDQLPKPTVARVQGGAFGGGVGLVACCDIAIASQDCRFGLTEARLGLLPAVISPYVIAAIGPRQARRFFATGEMFDAQTAQAIGLVHRVVEAEDLDDGVGEAVAQLLAAGPVATASAKQLVARVAAATDRTTLDRDNAALIAQLRTSAEGREGIAAFLERRDPEWRS